MQALGPGFKGEETAVQGGRWLKSESGIHVFQNIESVFLYLRSKLLPFLPRRALKKTPGETASLPVLLSLLKCSELLSFFLPVGGNRTECFSWILEGLLWSLPQRKSRERRKERQSLGEVQSYSLEYGSQTWTDPPVWWPSDAFNLLEARVPEAAFGSCGILWALPDTTEWGLFLTWLLAFSKTFPSVLRHYSQHQCVHHAYLYKRGFKKKTLIRVEECIRNNGTSVLTVSSPSRCAPA